MPALRQGLCLFRGRLRERECEAALRGTHSQAELGNDIGLMGALLPFVLRVVAGACVGRGSGQPTAAAGGAAARGVRGDWGILLRLDWEPLRERTLDHGSGQTRMPPQERRHEEVFGLGGLFHTHGSDGTRGFFVWRIPDIRRGDSRDGKQPPRIVSSAPLRCVLRSGASHSLQWGVMPALRQGLCLFRGRLRERECEAELRGTHSQAELGNDIGLMGALLPFVLRVVAGACVGRGSGQPTAAAGGAAARGVRGDWGIVSHAQERQHERL